MAYAAPGVASTKETTNYARLCRLLVDIGTQALRNTFDTIHPPANLTLFYQPIKPHCSLSKTRKLSIQYNGANSFLSSWLLFLLGTSTLHF